MQGEKNVGAVIIGSDFQALGAIRSLAEENVPVFVIEQDIGICRFSRHVTKRAKDFSLEKSDNFAEKLIEIAKRENLKGWVLYPNNDELVKLLSIHREVLEEWYRIPLPSWESVKNIYFKNNAYKIAKRLSIPIPRLYEGKNLNELLTLNLQFPIVLKPTCKEKYYPVMKKKAVRVNNKEEFIREYNSMRSIISPEEIVVQEMIEGGPKNLYSYVTLFGKGGAVAGISARRLRQHPMDFGHATTYAITVVEPILEKYSVKLLKEINYYGIAEVEFMKDEKSGCYKFIEVNGRIWGWHTLAQAAGVNIPYLLFKYMTNQKIDDPIIYENTKWVRLITDIPTVMKELFKRRMSLNDYVCSMRGTKEFAVFSMKDPIPFFMEFLMIPYLWMKRGF